MEGRTDGRTDGGWDEAGRGETVSGRQLNLPADDQLLVAQCGVAAVAVSGSWKHVKIELQISTQFLEKI